MSKVTLTKNDGTEQFRLHASSVQRTVANNIVSQSLKSAVSSIIGYDFDARFERVIVEFQMRDGVTTADYPNAGSYNRDPDYEMSRELERATKVWGPDASGNMDVLNWDGRNYDGVISELNIEERTTDETKAGDYTGSIEFTTLEIYARKQ